MELKAQTNFPVFNFSCTVTVLIYYNINNGTLINVVLIILLEIFGVIKVINILSQNVESYDSSSHNIYNVEFQMLNPKIPSVILLMQWDPQSRNLYVSKSRSECTNM